MKSNKTICSLGQILTKTVITALVIIGLLNSNLFVSGFYVPGTAPQDFAKGDIVEVKVSFYIP